MTKLCIYHGNCADGFGAAWAVRDALGDDVEFYAGIHGTPPPDVAGRDVIIVDFSYKRPVLEAMIENSRTLLVLDHHKTAKDDLMFLPPPPDGGYLNPSLDGSDWAEQAYRTNSSPAYAVFDMDRSGAMIAWDYFHPGKDAPKLLRHIQDRDLWRFELEGTREVQACLFSWPYDFDTWDTLMACGPDALVSDGAAIERKHFKDIKEFILVAKRSMSFAGYIVPCLNAPYFWSSDAGHIMCEGHPFAVCYWDEPNGRVFSLRSTDAGLDVSEIAKQFGGGGHRNAAGFKIPHIAGMEETMVLPNIMGLM